MEDSEDLKILAISFYKELFIADPSMDKNFMSGCFPPISEAVWMNLEADYSIC